MAFCITCSFWFSLHRVLQSSLRAIDPVIPPGEPRGLCPSEGTRGWSEKFIRVAHSSVGASTRVLFILQVKLYSLLYFCWLTFDKTTQREGNRSCSVYPPGRTVVSNGREPEGVDGRRVPGEEPASPGGAIPSGAEESPRPGAAAGERWTRCCPLWTCHQVAIRLLSYWINESSGNRNNLFSSFSLPVVVCDLLANLSGDRNTAAVYGCPRCWGANCCCFTESDRERWQPKVI